MTVVVSGLVDERRRAGLRGFEVMHKWEFIVLRTRKEVAMNAFYYFLAARSKL